MTKKKSDPSSVLDTALQVIQDEHVHYMGSAIDNEEHITRIVRFAESAGKLLSTSGLPRSEVRATIRRIIRYGRTLFIQEWSDGYVDDDDCEDIEATAEFDRYVPRSLRERKPKSSNQAL